MNVKQYTVAKSLEEAYQLLQENKDHYILGGGAWMKLSLKHVDTLISLDDCGLNTIQEHPDFVEIGALTTLRELETNPLILSLGNGVLSQAAKSIMGVTVRNIATIGGSVVSKFGFSDLIPVLLALDASLVFYHHGEIGLKAFVESKTIGRDILVSVKIPKKAVRAYFKKVATTALDFAILSIAISQSDSGTKILIGSRPGIAAFAEEAMSLIDAKGFSPEFIEEAAKKASEEVHFTSNQRGSEEYRRQLAYVYTKRGLKEVSSR